MDSSGSIWISCPDGQFPVCIKDSSPVSEGNVK